MSETRLVIWDDPTSWEQRYWHALYRFTSAPIWRRLWWAFNPFDFEP